MPAKTRLVSVATALLTAIAGLPAAAGVGELAVEIRRPTPEVVLTNSDTTIEVEGGASVFGGVRQLDLFLVLDTSRSLKETDPDDHRMAGAIGLVERLPLWSDIQIGVVAFDKKAQLVSGLTRNREAVIEALRSLDRHGSTNIGGGVMAALQGFDQGAREGSTRVILVFTDGKSNAKKARTAMEEARDRGVAIHSLLLGRDRWGKAILKEIAEGTGGSFLQVTDPKTLPEAFLDLRTTGIDEVTISVNGSEPIRAQLTAGSFYAEVPVQQGENHIVATAKSQDGRFRTDSVTLSLREPGCGELQIQAVIDGRPAHSISQRAVEIVFDASRSMWGQLEGRSKMEIAKQTLDDALDWLPQDLQLSLRAYGHQHRSTRRDCQDTELLVPTSPDNRPQIRAAIAGLRPNGQTPLGYALEQIDTDLGRFEGEKAVVLVTDGIESCGGDATAAARALQKHGHIPVHVIGFGLGDAEAEDLASLDAIAKVSGGRFLTVDSAEQLREALSTTVGTPFQVWRGDEPVLDGTLGAEEIISLPAGDYVVRLRSSPPREVAVTVESEVRHSVIFEKKKEAVTEAIWRDTAEYQVCEEPILAAAPEGDAGTIAEPFDPSQTASTAPAAPAPTPREETGTSVRKDTILEIDGGTIEIWQNLRPDRRAEWGVILRHPSARNGAKMVWTGDDRSMAGAVARSVSDTMTEVGSGAAAPAP